jgi:hypothetical protein
MNKNEFNGDAEDDEILKLNVSEKRKRNAFTKDDVDDPVVDAIWANFLKNGNLVNPGKDDQSTKASKLKRVKIYESDDDEKFLFGKAKRNASQMDSDESLLVEAKKAKTEIVETQKETNIDYYENLTTFENVIDLFESSPSKQSNNDLEEKQEEEEQQQGDWTDRILENFKKNGNFENVLDATHSRKQSKVFWPRRLSEKLLACSSKQATEAHNEHEE